MTAWRVQLKYDCGCNSLGITIPDKLGTKAGDKVKLSALSPKSFKVELS